MNDFRIFPESMLGWLRDKFGQDEGWINATDIRKKGNNRYKAEEWKQLMGLAVERGLAYSSDSYPSAPKNSIAFILPKVSEFFDSVLLQDPSFAYAPEIVLKHRGISPDSDLLDIVREYREVFSLLCCWEYHRVFDQGVITESIPIITKKYLEHQARELVAIYKLLKYGWAELPEKYRGNYSYNEHFLIILHKSLSEKIDLRRAIDDNPNPPSRRKQMRQIQDWNEDDILLDYKDLFKMAEDELRKLNTNLELPDFESDRSSSGYRILLLMELLKTSNCPSVKDALREFTEAEEKLNSLLLGSLRGLVDKRG